MGTARSAGRFGADLPALVACLQIAPKRNVSKVRAQFVLCAMVAAVLHSICFEASSFLNV